MNIRSPKQFFAPGRTRSLGLLTAALLIAGLVPAMFSPANAAGVTHYVSPATIGSAPGTDCATPGYNTIQAAINAATAGDIVQVCAGTYGEDVVVNKAGLQLLGAGIDNSTIEGPIGGGGATVQISASGVVVDGFSITRTGNTLADWNNTELNFAGVAVQGLTVNVELRNSRLYGNRTAIDINNSNGNSIFNSILENNHTGMIFRNQTDNTTLTENSIVNNRTVGILFLDASSGTNSPVQTAANSTFSNNNISGNWYGEIVDRQSGGSLPAAGTNLKDFSGNWYGTTSPVVSTANSAEPGYAALIPVSAGGTATDPGGQPDIAGPASANFDYTPLLGSGTDTAGTTGFQGDFSSLYVDAASAQTGSAEPIQESEDVALPGGTVNLKPGTHTEGNLVIDKSLTVVGVGAAEIHPAASFPNNNNAGSAWILVNQGVDFDLSNVSLVGTGFSVRQGLRSHGNTTVDSVDFDSLGSPGYGGFAVMGFGGTVPGGLGSDSHSGGLSASHLTITNSTFTDYGRVGVLIKGTGSTATISNNVFVGKGLGNHLDYAVEVGAGGTADVSDNSISNNRGTALSDGSTSAGILVTDYFGGGTSATVTDNDLFDNSTGIYLGYLISDESSLTAHLNRFDDNDSAALNASDESVFVADNNWWDDPSGPTHLLNAGGIGQLIEGDVAFTPWCVNPDCTTPPPPPTPTPTPTPTDPGGGDIVTPPGADPLPEGECNPATEICGSTGDDDADVNNGTVITGPGEDHIDIDTDGDTEQVTVDAGPDNDTVVLNVGEGTPEGTVIEVDGGDGDDTIIVNLPEGTTNVEIIIIGGDGDDTITYPNLEGLDGVTIVTTTGDGDDVVNVPPSPGTVRIIIRLGDGADAVVVNTGVGAAPKGASGAAVTGGFDIYGGAGRELIEGSTGADFLSGGGGRDSIFGKRGDDVLKGGKAVDRLFGGFGDDTIYGGKGKDVAKGGPGNDQLIGI
ncbi:MAG: hypothetical protein GEU71_00175 [Actinobacteria bacterium]|nr:hypothetical protein [Actinomycetota bacterium]